jgi:predicted enzyme related to lactoylglutathione lyase
MEKVDGIGGVFLAARDPGRLTAWYADHLGVPPPPTSYGEPAWTPGAGVTVFAVMPAATEPFGGSEHTWSLNFRVRDLDAMVRQLRDAGIDVTVDAETYPNGRFASLTDPEGNPLQLWQPGGVAS